MDFVEESIKPGSIVTEVFIRELHTLTVQGLDREGDRNPGSYRTNQVSIAQSKHLPPDTVLVPQYMAEFVAFVNREDPQKYDLMKVALAHHRFGWIHPFGNGNGRVVRLLTYALMIEYGFNVQEGGRLLNLTAVFCSDRDRYYEMLGVADTGTDDGLECWCTYVLTGVLAELKKVDQLLDFSYLLPWILVPAIRFSVERRWITELESKVLMIALNANGGQVRSADLAVAMPDLSDSQRTRRIGKLVESRMLVPTGPKSRIYTAGLANSYLVRGIMRSLADQGFISTRLVG
ncbi:Fic family protein [Orrella marina]|uniref:Cell filamentation protein Fic n=1 Tax=Orrella marina TaxID=2163011 RepID=A0A2R4XG90_9BURK|nr:Fic family protein [Orrella marina]AWB32693.1 cell filamentation protein Fic [Orrella marina]